MKSAAVSKCCEEHQDESIAALDPNRVVQHLLLSITLTRRRAVSASLLQTDRKASRTSWTSRTHDSVNLVSRARHDHMSLGPVIRGLPV